MYIRNMYNEARRQSVYVARAKRSERIDRKEKTCMLKIRVCVCVVCGAGREGNRDGENGKVG